MDSNLRVTFIDTPKVLRFLQKIRLPTRTEKKRERKEESDMKQ